VERRVWNGTAAVALHCSRGGPVPSISGLRASLRQSLPDYMILAFVVLKPLPLDGQRKVDRNELLRRTRTA